MTEMEFIMNNLKARRFRKSTERNYYKIWKLFNKFFIRLDRKPKTWQQRASSTIKSYISAIKTILKMEEITINDHVIDESRGDVPVARPLPDPILSFSHTFLLKSTCVRGPCPPPNGSTPPCGKSWIRHCMCSPCQHWLKHAG